MGEYAEYIDATNLRGPADVNFQITLTPALSRITGRGRNAA
jgi:hypothetical protein